MTSKPIYNQALSNVAQGAEIVDSSPISAPFMDVVFIQRSQVSSGYYLGVVRKLPALDNMALKSISCASPILFALILPYLLFTRRLLV